MTITKNNVISTEVEVHGVIGDTWAIAHFNAETGEMFALEPFNEDREGNRKFFNRISDDELQDMLEFEEIKVQALEEIPGNLKNIEF